MTKLPTRLQPLAAACAQFASHFIRWDITLPDDAVRRREKGTALASGWHIEFVFGAAGGREFVEYYASHRMTSDNHVRIWEDRSEEELEAKEDWIAHDPNERGAKHKAEAEFKGRHDRIAADLRARVFNG